MKRKIALSCEREQEIILFAGQFRKSREAIHFWGQMDAKREGRSESALLNQKSQR
jgi:hypothetical protein